MIYTFGDIRIPSAMVIAADKIRHENYKVNTIRGIQKHQAIDDDITRRFLQDLADITVWEPNEFNMVFFSAASGAEPHVDMLDSKEFFEVTYVIPVILPPSISTITADGMTVPLEEGVIYEFDHTKEHSMYVSDKEHGAVVIMVAVRR